MIFNSKLLLFGEYTIMQNSDALLMPYLKFSGKLDFVDNQSISDKSFAIESNRSIESFYQHIKKILPETSFNNRFKLTQLNRDIQNGLFFNSTIPVGYGIGSSGALVAAIISKYYKENNETLNDKELNHFKKNLALLESFFHGNSSGIDPLLSYLNKSLYIAKGHISVHEFSVDVLNPFLIDTEKSRSTSHLLNTYLKKCESSGYLNSINSKLVKVSNQCIDSIMKGDESVFFNSMKKLSIYQLEYFNEMILPEYSDIWKHGIETDEYYLKLCGAGGGGYILGFTKDFQKLKKFSISHRFKGIDLLSL